MKKLFLLGILFLFVSSSFAQDFEVNGINYNITSDIEPYTVEVISKSSKYEGNIIIPEQVQYNSQMYAVTGIAKAAFWNCTNLTSVVISNSVMSIGDFAFSGCNRLSSIEVPRSVTSIGSGAFDACSSLTSFAIPNSITYIGGLAFGHCISLTSIEIPNSVKSIGESAFFQCISLTSIEIPNSVTSIGESAFSFCTSLTSIVLFNSVTSIGKSAFVGCNSLTSIILPNTLADIGTNAFNLCEKLTSIEVTANNMYYTSIDGVLYNKDKTVIIKYPEGRVGEFAIPNFVISVNDMAFADSRNLTSIVLPNSVTTIGSYAFSNCISLTSIIIPKSVTSCGYYSFDGCINLTSIVCHSAIPPTSERNGFIVDHINITLYVPYQSVHLYQQAYEWKMFNVLPLPSVIGSGENLVSGRVYMDANANGKNDNNERGLSQQLLLILPDSVYAQTDNAGNYTFRCDTSNYQIQLVLPDNWRATSVTKYDVEVRTADTSGFDFGMAAIREESRSEVSIASLDGGRCFEPAPVYLTYSNNGTSIESGWLKYYPDSQFGAILKSVPAYDSLSADSSIVFWKMSDVMPFEQRNIMLQMQMPDFTAMGDTLVSALAFEDKALVQYSDTAKMIVRCSYDPNDKQVNPAGVQDEHFVLMSDPLEFTIRFQNTGNDVANRVVILDTLSQHLDLATFAVIASSHSVKTNRNNEGAVEFRFDNIMLADSTTNEPASHGFVKYRVKAKTGLPDSTVVENTSHIFFDYNPAVVTNTTAITMTYKIPIKEIPTTEDTTANVSHNPKSGKATASIHPNPFSKTALLEFDNPGKDVFELQIANVLGKTQQTIKSTGNLIVIERGDMPEGLYFFTLRNTANGLVYNGNFVVE